MVALFVDTVLTQFSATQIRESNTIRSSLNSKKGFLYSRLFSITIEILSER